MEHIRKIEEYIINHLEKNNPVFSNMPACPFARKERMENQIEYFETHIGTESPDQELIEKIRDFDTKPDRTTLILYDPMQLCCLNTAYDFAMKLEIALADLNILAIPLHPKDPFSVQGFRTRKTPFMMMTVQRKSLIFEAKRKLLGTSYYSLWDDVEERYLNRFEEYMREKNPSAFFTRLWWKEDVLQSLLQGNPKPEVTIGTTVEPLSRNDFHIWMHRWGRFHGWNPLCPTREESLSTVKSKLQEGFCVLATGHGGEKTGFLLHIHLKDNNEIGFFPNITEDWLNHKWTGGSYFWYFSEPEQ